ncbi:hypothetical protein EKM02_08475 [Flavobacterium sp. RSP49]|uniref:hypothetical protein n=1 Tax=Flavobacterium sp. RSP15 TaxID=2497485 RepID=UPI000F81A8F4|nr:hypothetical protein [Flavobacterium sp. RSP15]RTY85784.1 hypothetical protein EKM00_12935 [Flavobacterium sp. RSP15]RTZ00327.1 hypothetical protein EKM02_08475 [Flavobacterium sp. RSP49]
MYIKSKSQISKTKSIIRKWSASIFVLICFLFSSSVKAQCAMCRAALTSEGNTTTAAAVNDGIVYLMVIPYLLVAGIGYAIYRMKKNKSS